MAINIIRGNDSSEYKDSEVNINDFAGKLKNVYDKGIYDVEFVVDFQENSEHFKEEKLQDVIDEIKEFGQYNEMNITIAVCDSSNDISSDLEKYIADNYVEMPLPMPAMACEMDRSVLFEEAKEVTEENAHGDDYKNASLAMPKMAEAKPTKKTGLFGSIVASVAGAKASKSADIIEGTCEKNFSKLDERISHISDTFSDYLLYIIEQKGMTNAEVYKRALVDKKAFSKIKNNPDYHPKKITALCLCVGARLNLDETKDLLARAGYALSPCDKTDIIFSYFIENEIYDMIELDIQLEEYGLPCIIE